MEQSKKIQGASKGFDKRLMTPSAWNRPTLRSAWKRLQIGVVPAIFFTGGSVGIWPNVRLEGNKQCIKWLLLQCILRLYTAARTMRCPR